MFIQNIEHLNIYVSSKYANFVNFFLSWDEECVPGKINTNLRSKIRDTNKRDEHSCKVVPKSLHAEGRGVIVIIVALSCSVYYYCTTSFN